MTTATRTLWIGTYPHAGVPGPEGIWRVAVDAAGASFRGTELVAPSPAPSFLALADHVLYAVGEAEEGTVGVFGTDADGAVRPLGPAVATGGSFPCHVVATPGSVLVANYGSGSLSVVTTGEDGTFSGPVRVQPHVGSGPDPDRQEGPHAHFVATPERDRGHVLVADLGADALLRHDPAAPDGAAPSVAATFPPGTGPRHVVELGDGHLVVVAELDPALFVLAPTGGGTYDVRARYDVTSAVAVDGGRSLPSHVALAGSGSRVVVAVRGADVLAVHAVEPGPDGVPTLRHLADTPTGGAWPRHFAVLRPGPSTGPDATAPGHDLVVVANQNDVAGDLPVADAQGPTSTLALLRVDLETGAGELADTVTIPAPACVVEA
ncbi:lactonase family protein [Cellulosimicrobium arenosum]|uniref:Beta-propeller fold lactonase family protein n=1 Tax=Cellulosimicrobium arenosum TaxID=2708133 RepID=A0A927G8W9_9MICO|nr:beta-propeller fold lactonase family protein [Cellulosimicrobium arenosum]MBD8079112.1 beta-propeller fold lactonase family protein [Cellulosimicrobium arenosum]